ncbi:MAG: ThiF family adenylyltransferase [Clostridia bacterium]|nr:ThiF family adenylyltransferase [Clostridia bacterium]
MADIFDRTKLLIGDSGLQKLQNSNILIVGVGGVGGYALEVLTRSGVGKFTIVDGDNVDITNINRQIIATQSSIGKAKVQVFYDRMKDINPNVDVRALNLRFNADSLDLVFDRHYDYVIDAIDSVQDKLLLIKTAKEKGINIVSAMGAGNKIEMTDFAVIDIFKTQNDKLAKKMRKLLKDNGITHLDTVTNNAIPMQVDGNVIGSIAYMPPLAGIKLGGFVINKLLNNI